MRKRQEEASTADALIGDDSFVSIMQPQSKMLRRSSTRRQSSLLCNVLVGAVGLPLVMLMVVMQQHAGRGLSYSQGTTLPVDVQEKTLVTQLRSGGEAAERPTRITTQRYIADPPGGQNNQSEGVETTTEGLLLRSNPAAAAAAAASLESAVNTTAGDHLHYELLHPRPYLNESQQELLDRFHPKNAPIVRYYHPGGKELPQARVRMLAMLPKKRKVRPRAGHITSLMRDELVNIVWDGFHQANNTFQLLSPLVIRDKVPPPELSDFRSTETEVWVVDTTVHLPDSYKSKYSMMNEILRMAKHYYPNGNRNVPEGTNPRLTIVFVNYYDKLAGKEQPCTADLLNLMSYVGKANVRFVFGKVVTNRRWGETWENPGNIWNFTHACSLNETGLPPTLRAPYTVRSDYVHAVEGLYPKFLEGGEATKQLSSSSSPVNTVRPIDAWHHWDLERKSDRQDEYRKLARLRTSVSQLVLSLNGTTVDKPQLRTLQTRAETVSIGGTFGRTQVAEAYLGTLLTTKIVVVAQRDNWEDHYRLFEAFVGGAMVMTDNMLSLPFGLVDGESIVMYKSQQHLKELLLYYLQHEDARLAIARKGFEVAMSRHRSYHRMEEIFFGAPQSPAGLPYSPLVIAGD